MTAKVQIFGNGPRYAYFPGGRLLPGQEMAENKRMQQYSAVKEVGKRGENALEEGGTRMALQI